MTTTAPTHTDLNITANVRLLMTRDGIDQQGLAELMGMSQGAVSKRLNRTSPRPWRAHDLPQLAEAFKVPVEYLFRDPEENLRSRCNALVAA